MMAIFKKAHTDLMGPEYHIRIKYQINNNETRTNETFKSQDKDCNVSYETITVLLKPCKRKGFLRQLTRFLTEW